MEDNKNNDLPPKKKRGNSNMGELGKNTRFDKRPDFINKKGRPIQPARRLKVLFEKAGMPIEPLTKQTIAEETQVILSLSDDQLAFLFEPENKKMLSQFGKTVLKCLGKIQQTGRILDLQKAIEIAHPDYFLEAIQLNNVTQLINQNADTSVFSKEELQVLLKLQTKLEMKDKSNSQAAQSEEHLGEPQNETSKFE